MTHYHFFFLMLAACSGYSLLFGGRPERVTALIFIVAGMATPLVLPTFLARYRSPEVGEIVIDAAMYGAFLLIALRTDRYWTLWMSGLQGVQLSSHLLGLIGGRSANLAYAIVAHVLCYPMLMLLVVAVSRHRRRAGDRGIAKSWMR